MRTRWFFPCLAVLAAALVPAHGQAAEPLPPAVAVRPGPPVVPQPVLAHWRHVCGEARLIENYHVRAGGPLTVDSVTAGGQGDIWLMPCRSGAYAMTWLVVWQHDGLVDALTEPYRHNSIEPKPRLLSFPAFALLGDGLAVVERGSGEAAVADCIRLWGWTGRGFRDQGCGGSLRPAPVGRSVVR